jgi:hypothetical protein
MEKVSSELLTQIFNFLLDTDEKVLYIVCFVFAKK